ncbi:MAG: coproporphyrinogen III oxidase [Acidobacteria bacterium]|nr:MAG: coproporphyrinogen III oxidase [Acidobacteriota bacterium]
MTQSEDPGFQIAWYNREVQRQAGIYIHIPFCERKCTYCNFNTTDYFEDLAGRYITAASREIAYWGERHYEAAGSRMQVDTIFFGGGTPSIVAAHQLEELVLSCREAFEVVRDMEVTIEINPATFLRRKVDGWLKAGITRASVGVQSFLDRELVSLSRTHSADDARQTIAQLREAGFNNISLDLIAGLPEQTLADWQLNLGNALALQPEHLSLYLLEVKDGTQLFSQIKRGQRPLPDDDLAAEMYRMICDKTQAAGYDHYEISNFARVAEGDPAYPISSLRSKHNLKYWTGTPFYGIGCGAHSYDGIARWVNILRTETYIEKILEGGNAIADRNELTEADRAAEALFMGLRLSEGISLSEFRVEYGVDVIERYGHELPRLEDAGLIEMNGGRLALTTTGRLLSNEVFVSFV